MKLSPRLERVAHYVPAGARIADIGTDHAFIPIYLLLNKIIPFAVASDIHMGPLEKARVNLEKYRLTGKVRLCKGDGFEGILDDETDTAVIAGMGGEMIGEILQKTVPKGIETLIMQPMSNAHELRRAVFEAGFHPSVETLVEERGKIYTVIVARKGESEKWSQRDCRISPLLKNDPLFRPYLAREQKKVKNALKNLRHTNEPEITDAFLQLERWMNEELSS